MVVRVVWGRKAVERIDDGEEEQAQRSKEGAERKGRWASKTRHASQADTVDSGGGDRWECSTGVAKSGLGLSAG